MASVRPSKEELEHLYWGEQLGTGEIAQRLMVPSSTVNNWLRRMGIARRTRSEATRLSIAHGYRRARMPTKSVIRRDLTCRGCGANWRYEGTAVTTTCPYCGKSKSARDRASYVQNPERAAARKSLLIEYTCDKEACKDRSAKNRTLTRKRVFFRICGSINPRCARCGCDDPRLLEINHKNGGGARETQNGKYSGQFYLDIATGRRPTDDLELLCKPCNAIHCLEMKYGPIPMRLVWGEAAKVEGE